MDIMLLIMRSYDNLSGCFHIFYFKDSVNNFHMLKSTRKQPKILSLMEWPEKPLQYSSARLSPASARILADSGRSLQQILPISITHFLGASLLNEGNIDQLVDKYTNYNQQRLQILQQLQLKRSQYHNIHAADNNLQSFSKKSAHDLLTHQQITQEVDHKKQQRFNDDSTPVLLNSNKNPSYLTFSQISNASHHKMKDNTGRKIKTNKNPSQNPYAFPQRKKHKSGSNKKVIGKSKSPKQIQTQRSIYNDNLNNKQSPNKKSPVTFTLSKTKKSRNKSLANLKSLKSQEKKVFQDYRCDYFMPPELSKSASHQFLKNTAENKTKKHTHIPNYQPLNQYYDSSTSTKLMKRTTKNFDSTVYLNPIFDELSSAIDQLLQLTQKQALEIQMLDNLTNHDDKIQEKQRKRLMKIHDIQREQLKKLIYTLKLKIKSMKNRSILGITCTL